MNLIRHLLHIYYTLTGQEARRLNLRVSKRVRISLWGAVSPPFYISTGNDMAKIGDKVTATINPTNVAGNPAPVTEVDFLELTEQYDLVSFDGYSAVFEAVKPGTGAVVTVTAKSKAGVVLADTKPLPDVEEPPVDEEAVALNLTIA